MGVNPDCLLGHTNLISCPTDPTDPIFLLIPKNYEVKVQPQSGSHLGFLSRGGGANATIPELRGGGKDYSICFSICEE